MRKRRKMVSWITVLIMVVGSLFMGPTRPVEAATDYTKHWARDAILEWVDAGIMNGYPDGTFRPNEEVTRSEWAVLIHRAFYLPEGKALSFSDVREGRWFYSALERVVGAEYMKGYPDQTFKPASSISRQEVAVVLGHMLGESETTLEPATFVDNKAISSWARESVILVVDQGLMKGYPDGSFRPREFITRGEALTVLKRLQQERGEFSIWGNRVYGPEDGMKTLEGKVFLRGDDIRLQNTSINGILTITEEVGEGTVHLDNVTVTEETYFQGGGSDSIYVNGGEYQKIIIQKSEGKIRVVMISHRGARVVVAEEAHDTEVVLEGDFQHISVLSEEATLLFKEDSKVQQIEISQQSTGVQIITEERTQLNQILLHAPIQVTNQGTIREALGVAARTSSFHGNSPDRIQGGSTSSGGGAVGGGDDPMPPSGIYTVQVNRTVSEGVVEGEGSFEEGDTVTLTASAVSGISFLGWVDQQGDWLTTAGAYTFSMPAEEVELVAVYEKGSFSGGDGTLENPYKVARAYQLEAIKSADYPDKHYQQIANIDMATHYNRPFTPICNTLAKSFTGTYDGQGYEIKNLMVSGSGTYAGLFGRVNGGNLKNIALTDFDIDNGTSQYTGALAGHFINGEIRDIVLTGELEGGSNSGGLVGIAAGSTIHGISGNIEITSLGAQIGGLVGNSSETIITQAYFNGNVSGGSQTGGLLGYGGSGTAIRDSYALGNVRGDSNVGGLVGRSHGEIQYCFSATATVTGASIVGGLVGYLDDGGSFLDCFYDDDLLSLNRSVGSSDISTGARSTNQMYMETNYGGFDFTTIWTIQEGLSYPYFKWQGDDNVPRSPVEPEFAGGTGTSEDPYLVATASQLSNVRDHLDKHFRQTANIDLGGSSWADESGWLPLTVSTTLGLTGTYDGNGKTISNLTIDRSSNFVGLFGRIEPLGVVKDLTLEGVDVVGGNFVGGLVGYNSGQILRCQVEGSVVGNQQVGGLVGESAGLSSLIESCSAEIGINGYAKVGGLVGRLSTYSRVVSSSSRGTVESTHNWAGGLVGEQDMSTIENCISYGNVSGRSEVGGLVGKSRGSSIQESFTENQVSASYSLSKVGGLVGLLTEISLVDNSYSSSTVSGIGRVGGLVGEMGGDATASTTVSNTYSMGLVTATTEAGGLIGYKGSFSEITHSFYDGNTSGQNDTGKGDSKTTLEMKSIGTFTTAPVAWDFDSVWGIDGTNNNGYPYLRWAAR